MRDSGGEIPGQEFVDPVDRMFSDAREDLAQVGFWVQAIEFGGADQAIERSGTFTASVRASEQVIFAFMEAFA
jgi:hypothetical protein